LAKALTANFPRLSCTTSEAAMGQKGSRLSQYHEAVLTGKEQSDKLFLSGAGLSRSDVRYMCRYLDTHDAIEYIE
jgi:hypothetical protein